MVTVTERDQAVDMIHFRLVDVLQDWLSKEKSNLEDFIANPEGHVNYNPYVIVDFEALKQRIYILGQVADALIVISGHKNGEIYTRTQHDEAIESIPSPLLLRLSEWMEKRIEDMERMYYEYKSTAPNKEYLGLLTFDSPKFLEELAMYKDSFEGLKVLIQYTKEQEALANVEEEKPTDAEQGATTDGETV